MSDRPNELVRQALPMLDGLAHPRTTDIGHLLCVSARHVAAVEFGATLEARLRSEPDYPAAVLGTDPATVEITVLTLVLAGGRTALDLCAAALWLYLSPATTK